MNILTFYFIVLLCIVGFTGICYVFYFIHWKCCQWKVYQTATASRQNRADISWKISFITPLCWKASTFSPKGSSTCQYLCPNLPNKSGTLACLVLCSGPLIDCEIKSKDVSCRNGFTKSSSVASLLGTKNLNNSHSPR